MANEVPPVQVAGDLLEYLATWGGDGDRAGTASVGLAAVLPPALEELAGEGLVYLAAADDDSGSDDDSDPKADEARPQEPSRDATRTPSQNVRQRWQ